MWTTRTSGASLPRPYDSLSDGVARLSLVLRLLVHMRFRRCILCVCAFACVCVQSCASITCVAPDFALAPLVLSSAPMRRATRASAARCASPRGDFVRLCLNGRLLCPVFSSVARVSAVWFACALFVCSYALRACLSSTHVDARAHAHVLPARALDDQ